MTINSDPVFAKAPSMGNGGTSQFQIATAANTDLAGATGTIYSIFTAGADGAYVDWLNVQSRGTNVATVMRVFINNGSATTTAANNASLTEQPLVATTASATTSTQKYEIPVRTFLPAGYTIFVTLGTTVAGGWSVSAMGASLTV